MTRDQSDINKLKREVRTLKRMVDWLMDERGAYYDEDADAFTISMPPGFIGEERD